MKKTYLVFIIQGHNGQSPEGALTDSVACEIIDTDAASALKRAKKLVEIEKKQFFRVAQIIEKHIGT